MTVLKQIIKPITKLIALFLLLFTYACQEEGFTVEQRAEQIKSQIVRPQFPDNRISIVELGAIDDKNHDSSEAIKRAISTLSKSGGGTVVIPKGTFLTGPIHLENNIELHLEDGAHVLFKTNREAYLPVVHTSYEGIEIMNYSPLIYAKNKTNIAITGSGILDGQAGNKYWWPWAGKKEYGHVEGNPSQRNENTIPRQHEMNRLQTPIEERVFGTDHYFRPQFFQPLMCTNVLVQGVTFINAPFWVIHPLKSENITVENVTVNSHGPNNDGCNPEYSKNVQILGCVFDTGDDCIAIKSGRNEDGRRVGIPSENIVVEDCKMKDGHGGVVMGSEISAGVRNVVVLNCQMDSPNLDRAIRIKTNTMRGGFVDGLYVKNIQVGQVKEAVLKINTFYGHYGTQNGEFIPEIQNIYFENVTADNGGKYGILIKGRPEAKIKNIHFDNVNIKNSKKAPVIEHAEPIKLVSSFIPNMTE